MKKYIFLIIISTLFIACEEEPVPMLEVVVPPGNKTVLVEDFTGVSCPNCPEGARIVENLKTIYGKDRIISVAVHSIGFDNLHPNSQYEFKTENGQQMQDHLGTLFSKPAAAINRTISPGDGGRFYTIKEKWPDGIIEELNRPSEINLSIDLNYSPQSRNVDIEITFIPVDDIEVPLNVTAIIAESGLVDPQTDLQGLVEDFVHDHVLREILTSPEGDNLGNSFKKGEIYTRSLSTFTIPPQDGWWVAENCEIILFINESTSDSKRVLQTVSQKVVQ